MLPELNIKTLSFLPPFILGGMGVGISNATLAAACADCGMGGTIASVGLCGSGYDGGHFVTASGEAFAREVRHARSLTNGVIGANCMVALTNYENLVRVAVDEGVDYIISGAGLPLQLPSYVPEGGPLLIPVVSSARAAEIICRRWSAHYQRLPDAIVVEGALAGGHLGVPYKDIAAWDGGTLLNVCRDVLAVAANWGSPGSPIPVIAAGGLYDGKDIAAALRIGVSGVQLATRFLATHECPLPDTIKNALVAATPDDMVLIKSPVGMPARALRNHFIAEVLAGTTAPAHCFYHCLHTCDPDTTPYCIATAMFNAVEGRTDDSIVMVGSNASRIDHICSVRELVDDLIAETEMSLREPVTEIEAG
jgi:nitronate monooxygenase